MLLSSSVSVVGFDLERSMALIGGGGGGGGDGGGDGGGELSSTVGGTPSSLTANQSSRANFEMLCSPAELLLNHRDVSSLFVSSKFDYNPFHSIGNCVRVMLRLNDEDLAMRSVGPPSPP